MINKQSENYYINLGRVSFEYEIPLPRLRTLINYQELKREQRGRESDLEKSAKVVERYLGMKKK